MAPSPHITRARAAELAVAEAAGPTRTLASSESSDRTEVQPVPKPVVDPAVLLDAVKEDSSAGGITEEQQAAIALVGVGLTQAGVEVDVS